MVSGGLGAIGDMGSMYKGILRKKGSKNAANLE